MKFESVKIPSGVAPRTDTSLSESDQADFPGKVDKALARIARDTSDNQLVEELRPFAEAAPVQARFVRIDAHGLIAATDTITITTLDQPLQRPIYWLKISVNFVSILVLTFEAPGLASVIWLLRMSCARKLPATYSFSSVSD